MISSSLCNHLNIICAYYKAIKYILACPKIIFDFGLIWKRRRRWWWWLVVDEQQELISKYHYSALIRYSKTNQVILFSFAENNFWGEKTVYILNCVWYSILNTWSVLITIRISTTDPCLRHFSHLLSSNNQYTYMGQHRCAICKSTLLYLLTHWWPDFKTDLRCGNSADFSN